MKDQIKEKLPEWVAITVSFIIGLGSLFMSYQGIQSQRDITAEQNRTQEELTQLQAELQRNNSFAHLKISWGDFSFAVTNDGPNTANDIKIVLTLTYLDPIWNNVIKNISSFKLIDFKSSLFPSINTTNFETLDSQELAGNNSYIIYMKALAPGEELDTNIKLNRSISTKDYKIERQINLYFANQALSDYSADSINLEAFDILQQYVHTTYSLASFDVNASCDDCEVKQDSSYFTGTELYYLGINMPNSITIKSGKKYHEWIGNVEIGYYLPKGVTHLPLDFPQNLQITQDPTSQFNKDIVECVPPACTQF